MSKTLSRCDRKQLDTKFSYETFLEKAHFDDQEGNTQVELRRKIEEMGCVNWKTEGTGWA